MRPCTRTGVASISSEVSAFSNMLCIAVLLWAFQVSEYVLYIFLVASKQTVNAQVPTRVRVSTSPLTRVPEIEGLRQLQLKVLILKKNI